MPAKHHRRVDSWVLSPRAGVHLWISIAVDPLSGLCLWMSPLTQWVPGAGGASMLHGQSVLSCACPGAGSQGVMEEPRAAPLNIGPL